MCSFSASPTSYRNKAVIFKDASLAPQLGLPLKALTDMGAWNEVNKPAPLEYSRV